MSTINNYSTTKIESLVGELERIKGTGYNVTQRTSQSYTNLAAAIAATTDAPKKKGIVLTWRGDDGTWNQRRFNGESDADWSDETKWTDVCVATEDAPAPLHDVIYIDQTISDPAGMISGDVNGECIQWIRNNSHRYVTQSFDETNGITLKQLDDTDGTKYADGTDASTDITEKDVFMKMPDFWYYGTEGDNVEIHFTNGMPSDPDNWVKWDGNTLIGVYEANYGTELRSISGVASTGDISQSQFKSHAAAKGTGYQIVDWQMHCVMGILFYAWYGNTNSQVVCGSGTNSYTKETGQTNFLGMTDTDSTNGNTMSINFWGLENWWGNKFEWMEGMESTAKDTMQVISPDPTATRTLSWPYDGSWGKKLKFGKYCDLNKTIADDASDSTYYCDINYGSDASSRVALRSYSDSFTSGGVSFASADDTASGMSANYGARLCYRGPVSIMEEGEGTEPEQGLDPAEAPNGVYVYSSDGKLYDPSSWDTSLNDNALGVAVVTDNCKFAISKDLPTANNIAWSSALYGTDVNGILTTTSQATAITDYAGQDNTDLIMDASAIENESNNAAKYCYAQTLNGEYGYLPSAGELAVMYNNKSDIDEALMLIGSKSISNRCDEFDSTNAPWFWSSTENSSDFSWHLSWEYRSLHFNNRNKASTSSYVYAFPMFPFSSQSNYNNASTDNN